MSICLQSDALEVQMRAYEDTSRAASSAAAQLGTQLQGLLAAQVRMCVAAHTADCVPAPPLKGRLIPKAR